MTEREEKYKVSRQFAGKHKGDTIILTATAPSLAQVDLKKLKGFTTIGCNAILRHGDFEPTYVIVGDRRVYLREQADLEAACQRIPILLSTTIWDAKVKCGDAIAPPEPKWKYFPWRVGTCRTPFNWDNFTMPMCSMATVVGPMLQAAVIMGAKRVGVLGVDLGMPVKGPMHFYEDDGAGRKEATINRRQPKTEGMVTLGEDITHRLLGEAKREMERRGIETRNLSPIRRTPFANIFGGNYDLDRFLADA